MISATMQGGENVSIDQEKMIVEALPSLYPLQEFEEKAIQTILDALPPAQPKRGRWIYCEDSMADCVDGYRCDQCGFFVPWDYQHKSIDYIKDYNFCPKCGSYNGGEQDE